MSQHIQGDIFKESMDRQSELTVVFGHIGFNQMRQYWRKFALPIPTLAHVHDPFLALSGKPCHVFSRRWFWFVREGENHGLTDQQMISALEAALSWAAAYIVTTVVTNGIADTDHGRDTAANRQSDDRRARFLSQWAVEREQAEGLSITLVSLNDVFSRNAL